MTIKTLVSDYVFNLSKKVLSKIEINLLEKGLGLSPSPSFINEADSRKGLLRIQKKYGM